MKNEIKEKTNEPIMLRLPPSLVDELDQAKIDFRKRISRRKRNRLSRSKLCELILDAVIRNYQCERNDSVLYDIVSSWQKHNS